MNNRFDIKDTEQIVIQQMPDQQRRIHDKVQNPLGNQPDYEFLHHNPDIVSAFEYHADRHPDRPAYANQDIELSFGDIEVRANQLANTLIRQDNDDKTPILLAIEPGPALYIACLGVMKSGRAFVFCDPHIPPGRLKSMSKTAGVKTIVCTEDLYAGILKWSEASSIICLDKIGRHEDSSRPAHSIAPESAAYFLFTSGSTGEPKGVIRTHYNVVVDAALRSCMWRLAYPDRVLMLSSGTAQAASIMVGCMIAGACLVTHYTAKYGFENVLELMRMRSVSIISMTATLYRKLVALIDGGTDLPSLRLIRLGGSTVYNDDITRYQRSFSDKVLFFTSYSSSETISNTYFFADKQSAPNGALAPGGYPVPGRTIEIVDDLGQTMPAGQSGPIRITSRFISDGYVGAGKGTNSCFEKMPDGRVCCLMTDRGYMDETGCLFIQGRTNNSANIHGFVTNLSELELQLLALPDVNQVVVCVQTGDDHEDELAAYIVPDQTQHDPTERIRKNLSSSLPRHMVPTNWIYLNEMPLGHSGKVDKNALPNQSQIQFNEAEEHMPPQTDSEVTLSRIWEDVLKTKITHQKANFLLSGGNSLQAMTLNRKIEEEFGVSITIQEIFSTPTLSKMAEKIDQKRSIPDS